MNVVCTHCAHEFELSDEAAAQTGGSTSCPSCGEQTALEAVPSGATLPWHPGQEGMPPAPGEAHDGMFDAAVAASEADAAAESGAAPPPQPEPTPAPPPTPPPTPAPAAAATPKKPKEQSVLFKLGEMQAMGIESASRQGGGPPEASGLLDIRMLAANIHQHEEEERAHNVQFVGKAKASGPVALPTSGPALAPAPAERKGKAGLIAAVVVFGVLVVAAVVLIYFVYAGRDQGKGEASGQASAAMEAMEPDMRPAVMEAMEPAMRPVMEPAMEPVMEPPRPKKLPRKLRRKHIKAGVATVADKIADCKKDRKGRFKLKITVVGRTGAVKRVRISGRRNRKSKTGKCLKALFEKAQFTPFKRRSQSFTHRLRIK